ncbi:hypothetical protein C8J57DRAFT_1076553 [Mycena rebaudengoi]|nr:hypothetical protein C8J57DRAFT_1076553 [Mycena rebaudengoi]
MGGRKLVYALSHALGLPSASTIRTSNPPKLLPSVAAPTAAEIATNITTFFGPDFQSAKHRKAGHCLMMDGVHICQRCRWHRPTNQIIGLCQEHSGGLDLTMSNMPSVLHVLDKVHGDEPTCHYARESTVIAVGAFRNDHYHGLPIAQVQTCKSQKGPDIARLIQSVLDQWEIHGAPHNGPLWVFGADGASEYREAAFIKFMSHELSSDPTSPLYVKLSGLRGLNLRCGKNGTVSAGDTKHMAKRLGTTMRSNEGMLIDQTVINRPILTQWLERLPDQTPESVAILVDPADHQNVPRAYSLIKAFISVGFKNPESGDDLSPTDQSTRRAFALAGEMWDAFLEAFVNPDLSLSEQLTSLSKFGHIAFVLYRLHGSSFLSNQLYGDLQALVKAAFFCVAQQQNLDPEQAFYLYQLGSDRLEEMFAETRTESHDSNFDALQLSERLSSAVDSVGIFEEHPEWHQGHIRRSWSGKEMDHVNPSYYTADMKSGNAFLPGIWNSGCLAAWKAMQRNGIIVDLDQLLSLPDVDLLSPNGGGVFPGRSREKDRSLPPDAAPSASGAEPPPPASALPPADVTPVPDPCQEDTEPDLPESDVPNVFLDDFLAEPEHFSSTAPAPEASVAAKSNDWLEVSLENGSTKKVHKASVLSTLFNSDYKRLATSRLLRVRCYSADGRKPSFNHQEISGEHSFTVGDIAVALIRSHNTVAAAVVKVTVIEKDNARLGQIDVEELGCPESQAKTTGQLLILRDIVVPGEGMPSSRKWLWTGDFGKFDPIKGAASTVEAGTRRALTVKIPGAFLHPLDADIEESQHLSGADLEAIREKQYSHTWAVPNEDLEAVVSAMYESLDPALVVRLLPKHGKSDNFPYSDSCGNAFPLHPYHAHISQQRDSEKIDCYQCHLPIKRDDARAHAGGHILRAIRGFPEPGLFETVSTDDPCGFCGRSGCRVELSKAGKSFKMASTCARRHPISYGHAKKFSNKTPSTNIPVFCDLCPEIPPQKNRPAFWKYSIYRHIQQSHPRHWHDFDNTPFDISK